MTIFIDGHKFGYELQRVLQMFCFGEKVKVENGAPSNDFVGDYVHTLLEGCRLEVRARMLAAHETFDNTDDAFNFNKPLSMLTWDEIKTGDSKNEIEHKFGVMIYKIASQATGLTPEWGVLTGIRPVKLFIARMNNGMSKEALRKHFIDECLMSENRFSLAYQTALEQIPTLQRSTSDSFSLYISIPFCPTRCSYCSFVSHSVEQAAKLIPDYLDKLCDELVYTARIVSDLKLKLRTVYFGGGTPTSLEAPQLERIMKTIAENFDLSELWEYTVEAGRPDTITKSKLKVLKENGANRISINPQTLSDSVLKCIGRKHTTAQTLDAFNMARDMGFNNVNMDLIAGLPSDTPESFRKTMDGVIKLSPENITVHTLTVKRAARVTCEQARAELQCVRYMVDYAREKAFGEGMKPYYLYRQTGSLAALENVGYSVDGAQGLYNVYIMDETHSILAVGAGASTKLCGDVGEKIKRIYNFKYPYEYISQFKTILERKDEVRSSYLKQTL